MRCQLMSANPRVTVTERVFEWPADWRDPRPKDVVSVHAQLYLIEFMVWHPLGEDAVGKPMLCLYVHPGELPTGKIEPHTPRGRATPNAPRKQYPDEQ